MRIKKVIQHTGRENWDKKREGGKPAAVYAVRTVPFCRADGGGRVPNAGKRKKKKSGLHLHCNAWGKKGPKVRFGGNFARGKRKAASVLGEMMGRKPLMRGNNKNCF